MFSLTIVFGPGPMVWTLMFKTKEQLLESQQALHDAKDGGSDFDLSDDFGQTCHLKSSETHGWMIEDLEQSKLAHIERALHQARTKVKADEMASADPVMRAAATRQAGGAILQPMPGMPQFQNGRMPS